MKAKRAKGVIVTFPDMEPSGVLAVEAKTIQKQKQEERIARAERRANTPVPNYIAYSFLFPNFDPKTHKGAPRPLPKCRVCCDAVIHPMEHHVCPGFTPKFKEHTKESHERFEARREAIRESRSLDAGVFCSVCGEHMEDPEDGQWHWEDHEGRPERNHYAIDGEPDGDLDGYDDEPEYDWCDEDEDEGD